MRRLLVVYVEKALNPFRDEPVASDEQAAHNICGAQSEQCNYITCLEQVHDCLFSPIAPKRSKNKKAAVACGFFQNVAEERP
jgi:hypothetical protein